MTSTAPLALAPTNPRPTVGALLGVLAAATLAACGGPNDIDTHVVFDADGSAFLGVFHTNGPDLRTIEVTNHGELVEERITGDSSCTVIYPYQLGPWIDCAQGGVAAIIPPNERGGIDLVIEGEGIDAHVSMDMFLATRTEVLPSLTAPANSASRAAAGWPYHRDCLLERVVDGELEDGEVTILNEEGNSVTTTAQLSEGNLRVDVPALAPGDYVVAVVVYVDEPQEAQCDGVVNCTFSGTYEVNLGLTVQ